MTWDERINAARPRGEFTADDRFDAGGWLTCACGEQDSSLMDPGSVPGPWDEELRHFGESFEDHVDNDDFDGALLYLGKIQRRASQLLPAPEKVP